MKVLICKKEIENIMNNPSDEKMKEMVFNCQNMCYDSKMELLQIKRDTQTCKDELKRDTEKLKTEVIKIFR